MEPAPISAADRPRSGRLQGAGAAVIVDSEQHAALGWPCDDRHQTFWRTVTNILRESIFLAGWPGGFAQARSLVQPKAA